MKRLVILADTHMPRRGRELPDAVVRACREADLIVHLGDFTGLDVALYLETLAPLEAVHGNNDCAEVQAWFPAMRRLTLGKHTLALTHGHIAGRTALQAAESTTDADVVLYGHSHAARISWQGPRLLFNPGSPTERRFAPYRSFGILTIGDSLDPVIVPVP